MHLLFCPKERDLYRLGGSQGPSGLVWKISPPPGFNPWTVQPVANCYTDYAIPPLPKAGRRKFKEVWSKGSNVVTFNQNTGRELPHISVQNPKTVKGFIEPSKSQTFMKQDKSLQHQKSDINMTDGWTCNMGHRVLMQNVCILFTKRPNKELW